jgi:hypothetical protein
MEWWESRLGGCDGTHRAAGTFAHPWLPYQAHHLPAARRDLPQELVQCGEFSLPPDEPTAEPQLQAHQRRAPLHQP